MGGEERKWRYEGRKAEEKDDVIGEGRGEERQEEGRRGRKREGEAGRGEER
jgi:hypothetical protein